LTLTPKQKKPLTMKKPDMAYKTFVDMGQN